VVTGLRYWQHWFQRCLQILSISLLKLCSPNVLVSFSISVTNTGEKQLKRQERFILLMVSEVSVHHGGEGGQGSSHHGGEEAEWIHNRKEPEQDIVPKATLPLTYFLQPRPAFHSSTRWKSVWVLNHQWINQFIRSDPPPWSNCLWKCPHRHTLKCVLLI
jgi:hypothetical protein